MKVLLLNTYDTGGGAAIAAKRLKESLKREGVDCKILVMIKKTLDDDVICDTPILKAIAHRFLNKIPLLLYPKNKTTYFSPAIFGINIQKYLNIVKPDIVHLHWICGGFLKIEDLIRINKQYPTVWTLHDDWCFTGGCHIKWDCRRFEKLCCYCPQLRAKKENDLSKFVFERKVNCYSKFERIVFVGLSKWMKDCAERSSLLRGKKIINLPNPIDTTIFRKKDKILCKNIFNFDMNKKIVLVNAANSNKDTNKGFKFVVDLFKKNLFENVELALIGGSADSVKKIFNVKVHCIPYIRDEKEMSNLYNACDLTIVPSIQETLSNTIMESLACGTPVLAFNVAGNNDLVDHMKNGYLAKPFDINDLAKGFKWILDSSNFSEISHYAHQKVLYNFDSKIVAKKYIQLYEKLLNN